MVLQLRMDYTGLFTLKTPLVSEKNNIQYRHVGPILRLHSVCVCLHLLIRKLYVTFHSYKKWLIDIFLTLFFSKSLGKWDRKGGQKQISTSIKVKVTQETHSNSKTLLSQEAGKGVDFLRAMIKARDIWPLTSLKTRYCYATQDSQ